MKRGKSSKSRHRRKSKAHEYTDHDPRHLQKVPEDWEMAQGDIESRVTKVGQNSINYASVVGVPSSGSSSSFWEQVQELGQDAMKLMGKQEPKFAPGKQEAMLDEYAQDVKAIEEGDFSANTGEVLPGIFLDDYETQDWGMEQIEAACNTLLAEIENSQPHSDHQKLGLKMLLKLMDRHSSATNYIQRNMEDVVNKSMPGLLKRKVSPTAFQLAPLLAALAPRLGEEMSKLNIVTRMVKFMTFEMNLAARMMQHRIRLKLNRRMEAQLDVSYPRDVAIRKQLMINMQSDHLNKKWRSMHSDPLGGVVSETTATFYLEVLLALTSKGRGEGASRFYHNDRVILVQSFGLIVLTQYLANFMHEGKCLAAKILLNIAQEKALILDVLNAQVISCLTQLLQKTNSTSPEGLEIACLILEVIDAIANMSLKFIDINVPNSGPVRAADTGSVVTLPTVASINTISEPVNDEELLSMHSRQKLDTAIRKHIVEPQLFKVLVGLLRWGVDSRVFLGTVMALHKLCCTVGYFSCLEEIMAYAGQGLSMLVEGLQTQEDYVPIACMTLLIQLASKEEGRMGLTKSGAIEMLSPLCCSPVSAHKTVSLLALSTIQAMARKGHCPSTRPSHLALDASNSTLVLRLYEETYEMLVAKSQQEARLSVSYLVTEAVIPNFEAWLVRPNRPAHYFDLPKVQTYLGAIILHRLCINDKACEILFSQATIRYLCYTIQTNYTVLAEGEFRRMSSRSMSLFFQSTQAACRALGCISLIDSVLIPNARETVFGQLSDTNALDEVSRLLAIPSIRETFGYSDYVQNATAAAVLVSSLSPVPSSEQNAGTFVETRETEKESIKACLPHLKRLIKQCGEKLVNLIQLTDSIELLKSTCMALSKLSSTNETCHDLIGKGVIKAIGRLVPKGRPMLASVLEQQHEPGQPSVIDETKADDNLRKLASLPSSFFRLLASLARLPEGKKSLLSFGLLKRSLERLNIRPSMQNPLKNHATQSEIALFLARMANTFDMESGSANDYILSEKYACIPCLTTLLREGKTFRGKYNALFALAELSSDTVRAVPLIVKAGALVPVFRVLKDDNSPQGLLRQALNLVRNVVHYPDRKYHKELLEKYRGRETLTRIGSNINLEREFGGISDRESLGDIARDCLELITMGIKVKAQHSSSGNLYEGEKGLSRQSFNCNYGQTAANNEDMQILDLNGQSASPAGGNAQLKQSESFSSIKSQSAPPLQGSYLDCGVSKCGSLRSKEVHGNSILPTIDTNKLTCGFDEDDESVHDSTRKTSVGNLSARDPKFRNEVRMRKQIYSVGRFDATEPLAPADRYREMTSIPQKSKSVSRRNKIKSAQHSSRKGRRNKRSPNQHDSQESVDFKTKTSVISLKDCPALAVTRPPPRKPISADGTGQSTSKDTISDQILGSDSMKFSRSEQFVQFSRPPQTDHSYPQPEPMPGHHKKSSQQSARVGGFKVKGYLLDPTFHEDTTFLSKQKTSLKGKTFENSKEIDPNDQKHNLEKERFVHTADILGQRVQIESLRSPVLRPSSPITYRNVEHAVFQDLEQKSKTITL